MGEIIKASAASANITEDLETTLKNAKSRGGTWKTYAVARIPPVLSAIEDLKTKKAPAEEQLKIAEADLVTATIQARKVLGKVGDDLWNALGRPAVDPYYSLLFPGGIAGITDGEAMDQPERMMLLVDLLRTGVHPRLTADITGPAAEAIEAEAKNLRIRLDAVRAARTSVGHVEKMHHAVARAGQMTLTGLKATYKGEKFTEAEIHTIIPAHHYRAQAAARKRKKAEAEEKARSEAKPEPEPQRKPEPKEEKPQPSDVEPPAANG